MAKIIIEIETGAGPKDFIIAPDEVTSSGNSVYRISNGMSHSIIEAVGSLMYARELERNPPVPEDHDLFTTKE